MDTEQTYPAGWPQTKSGEPAKLLTIQEAADVIGVSREYLRKQHQTGKIQAAGRNAQGWILVEAAVVLDYRARRIERLDRRAVVTNGQ